jgi:nickel superoxide dismutase
MFKFLLPHVTAEAHCDVPCGIYDPTAAKVAAMTVLRMVNQINDLHLPEVSDAHAVTHYQNDLVRRIKTKEEHSMICKTELWTLWSDYFKPEHLEKYADLHEKFWQATKLCSQNKQDVSAERAKALVLAVDEIAKIFYATKNDDARFNSYKDVTDKLF